MTAPSAYPLVWPAGWPRTARPEAARFKVTLHGAMTFLKNELRLLGGTDMLLSSNVALGSDKPKDAGVAVYFTYEGEPTCIPCDRWMLVEHNVQAIAKTIEALRGIDRWGAKDMIRAAFRGYRAIAGPGAERPWRDVLELRDAGQVDEHCIRAAHRRLSLERHPDRHGGSDAMMAELNTARDRALAEIEQSGL